MVSLHTSPTEPPGSADAGGMNVVEWNAALALAGLGYEVDLLTRRSRPDQAPVSQIQPNLRLLHLEAGPVQPLPKSAIDQYIPQFAEGLAKLDGYDLYHCQHWMSGLAALDLAKARHVPLVASYHSVAAKPGRDLSEGEPPESPARVPGEARLAREADHVIAISAAEARTVIVRCGADPAKVTIIPPGVDLELFSPGERPDSTSGARPYLAFAARLQPLKGADLAIAALAYIDPAIRPDLKIAGAESLDFASYGAGLRAQVEEYGLQDYVSFIGPQSRGELAQLLREATLVLVPSYSETFGLVALEAAACGTPVIASAAGGLREAVVHGETGQLMDSRGPADWARAITLLLTDTALWQREAIVARVHARRFTWQAMARRVARVYEDLWEAW